MTTKLIREKYKISVKILQFLQILSTGSWYRLTLTNTDMSTLERYWPDTIGRFQYLCIPIIN